MQLRKYHALGNDYLVVAAGGARETGGRRIDEALARSLCHRHRGFGADGVLEPVSAAADGNTHTVRIWNPDGSTAEKSGNGLRIHARWLVDAGHAPPVHQIRVALPDGTQGSPNRCEVDADGVTIDLGAPTFAPAEIPTTVPLAGSPHSIDGKEWLLWAVGMGNPHCVVFTESDLDGLPWRTVGAKLEIASPFPRRTNVQFARVRSRRAVDVRIWERGAGETSASGSSACAVFAVGRRRGLLDTSATMAMPGGDLFVCETASGTLSLRGPVTYVGELLLPRSGLTLS